VVLVVLLLLGGRWGRGSETFGEDPYLTSVMATRVVQGLQGSSKEYKKVCVPQRVCLRVCVCVPQHVCVCVCECVCCTSRCRAGPCMVPAAAWA
jgi:hypothetical protein